MAIAVLGASSLLGKSLIEKLTAWNYPIESIVAVDNAIDDENSTLEIAENKYDLLDPSEADWGSVQAVIGCDEKLVQTYSDDILNFGGVLINASATEVIGATSTLTMEDGDWVGAQGAYQLPNSVVIMLTHLLKRLENEVGIEAVHVSVLLAVSENGQEGIDELASQTARLLNGLPIEPNIYSRQIAFNLLPQAIHPSTIADDIEQQLGLIFSHSEPEVAAHSVTVPVFYGAMAQVTVNCQGRVSIAECVDIWREIDSVEIQLDEPVTLVTDLNQNIYTSVSQIRQSPAQPRQLKFCVQADVMNACVVPYLAKLIQRIGGM
ncbi:Asd/ArgC dimerization domain-containing protein [Celerinatantimonas diazotrophica]|uniref:Aspartate-semialdehyde dehydrogenase n=1 Tax=Celerinatantimonas diazotrophica TaxID=412034 RepID=A0A4R1JAF0_9GAMM|nr:Asd/ArgC dimerization domain-containing protein [Celerinatantimonas diazotrophica]TCK47464.1 aspartate-semialdehyde dehydrogenase [Celerinatantimonas diazotrophica]CAG9296920.1 USG-1 protein [Celerinatantimonas diazotrophica]